MTDEQEYGGDPPCWAHLFEEETIGIKNQLEALEPAAIALIDQLELAEPATVDMLRERHVETVKAFAGEAVGEMRPAFHLEVGLASCPGATRREDPERDGSHDRVIDRTQK